MCIQHNQDKFHTPHNIGKINSKLKLDYVYPSGYLCACEANCASLIYSTSDFSSLGFYISSHALPEPYFENLDKCHLLSSS